MFGYVPHFLFWGLLSKYRYFDISMWYCELWHHMFRITSSRCLTPQEYFLWITPVMDGYKKVCGQLIMEKSIYLNSRQKWIFLLIPSGVAPLRIIFFSCENIQFGVFRAEIFIPWCIVQKYWSGIVTCYTAITIDYLDLTNASDQAKQWIIWNRADLASFLFN